jgi:hypothetical protein
MNKTAFYAVLTVLVLGIIYVFATSERPPDTGMTRTPKQYIEQVEHAKAARQTDSQEIDSLEADPSSNR